MKKQKRKSRPPASKKRRPAAKPAPRPATPAPAAARPAAADDRAALLDAARRALGDGRWPAALDAARRILMLAPDDAEALNLAGVARFHLGDPAEARSLFETALAFAPGHAEARGNLGNVLRAMGDLDSAEDAYRAVLASRPDDLDARFNLGVTLEIAGRFAEAEQAFRDCLARAPGHVEARFHQGNLMKALNRLPAALEIYDEVVKADPRHADALTNRGAVLQETGRPLEALESYRRALMARPDHVDARYNLATLLQETGRPEEALAEYRDVLRRRPDHAGAQVNIAYALKEMDRLDDAVAACERAIALAPDYDKVHANLGDLYLEMGRPRDALAVAAAYLERHPGNTSLLAFQAIALNEAGDEAALDRLLDYDRLLRPRRIEAPEGFASVADFNRALARHVRSHPSLVYAPASHATRFGRHSGELLVEPKGPMAPFEQVIQNAVADYRAALAPDPSHPFLAQRPAAWNLSVWGVVMEDRGHQLAHIHPAAWLSGVYYPEIPDVVRADDPDHQGWIEFGRPPDDFHATREPRLTIIRPEDGLMVLFPSYVYHRTVPFHAPVERMSIAFDVVPAGD